MIMEHRVVFLMVLLYIGTKKHWWKSIFESPLFQNSLEAADEEPSVPAVGEDVQGFAVTFQIATYYFPLARSLIFQKHNIALVSHVWLRQLPCGCDSVHEGRGRPRFHTPSTGSADTLPVSICCPGAPTRVTVAQSNKALEQKRRSCQNSLHLSCKILSDRFTRRLHRGMVLLTRPLRKSFGESLVQAKTKRGTEELVLGEALGRHRRVVPELFQVLVARGPHLSTAGLGWQ